MALLSISIGNVLIYLLSLIAIGIINEIYLSSLSLGLYRYEAILFLIIAIYVILPSVSISIVFQTFDKHVLIQSSHDLHFHTRWNC